MRVEMMNINKTFQTTQVLKNAGITVGDSEIHALMGENGAGKSTLMKILTGVYTKDSGTVVIDGKEVEFDNIKESENVRIAFIHQELNVLNNMSIVDNMFLGRPLKNKFGFLQQNKMKEIVKEKLALLGMNVDPETYVQNISVGERQLLEIAKALLMDAKLIIMDEPTAALTNKETELLFNIIRDLKKQGVSFIYISHRMEEIFELCDRVTVMRDGAFIKDLDVCDTSFDEIVSLMVGYDLEDRFPRTETVPSDVVLEVKNLTKQGKFHDVSFDVRKGEIVGFSGLMGAGRTDVMHGIFGSVPIDSGEIVVNGKTVKIKNPIDAKRLGIGFITEDRKDEGLILDSSIAENMLLPSLKLFTKNKFIHHPTLNDYADSYIKKLNIRTSGKHQDVAKLSGGNQQKVVIAKWLITKPDIIILDEPTRGVDVGAKREIYEIINELKKEGVAIIVVSSELPEILGICDRIVVMHEKKVTAIIEHEEATQEKIIEYATGGGK